VFAESTGQPVAGATITLSPHFENAVLALLSQSDPLPPVAPVRTDENGTFLFQDIVAGAYDVTVRRDGFMPVFLGPRTEDLARTHVTLAPGERRGNFRVGLIRSAIIEGRIQLENRFTSGIPVRLVLPDATDTPVTQTVSGEGGLYHIEGFLPGRYILLAGSPTALSGSPARSFARLVTVATTDPLPMDFSLHSKGGYSIRGKVDLLGIAPAGVGMNVDLITQDGSGKIRLAAANFKYSPQSGDFEISDLLPGFYGLNALLKDPPNSVVCARDGVLVSESDVTGIELSFDVCGGL
jgi:hypothetical protein